MTGSYGWTSWGWAEAGVLGAFRVWKHYTGPMVAVHTGYEGDHDLLLSHLNETLEDEAGIEHVPTAAERDQERRDAAEWQTVQDIKATALRLEAENAELRRKLGEAVDALQRAVTESRRRRTAPRTW
jgi:hypothetical protein